MYNFSSQIEVFGIKMRKTARSAIYFLKIGQQTKQVWPPLQDRVTRKKCVSPV
jgi:hypothetical protein